jgi:ribosomal protein S18 acetylase RimI-like enzyme
MSNNLVYRYNPVRADIKSVEEIVASTGFFLPHEVPVAIELIQERLDKGIESGYQFIFVEVNGKTIAYACYGEIPCTKGSFDLYWIVTHNDFRGKGIGKQLLIEVEKQIKVIGGRVIYIETSSKPLYEPTRKFYENYGCKTEAILKDFYDLNDSKYLYTIWLYD